MADVLNSRRPGNGAMVTASVGLMGTEMTVKLLWALLLDMSDLGVARVLV